MKTPLGRSREQGCLRREFRPSFLLNRKVIQVDCNWHLSALTDLASIAETSLRKHPSAAKWGGDGSLTRHCRL